MKKDTKVDEYLNKQPAKQRAILKKIRSIVFKALPGGTEQISYGVPGYKLNGRPVVYFAGFKEHVSLFPTSAGVRKFRAQLLKYVTSKGTIKFSMEEPVPYSLITAITRYMAKTAVKAGNRMKNIMD